MTELPVRFTRLFDNQRHALCRVTLVLKDPFRSLVEAISHEHRQYAYRLSTRIPKRPEVADHGCKHDPDLQLNVPEDRTHAGAGQAAFQRESRLAILGLLPDRRDRLFDRRMSVKQTLACPYVGFVPQHALAIHAC